MSGLFSDAQVQQQTPAKVPAAPNRSSAEVEALAERQRKMFSGAGSMTKNYFTGGDSGTLSTVSKSLGGGV